MKLSIILALCLCGCSAAQQQAERRAEVNLVQDCHEVAQDGLAPEWVRLECDVLDGIAVMTLPRAGYPVTITTTDGGSKQVCP